METDDLSQKCKEVYRAPGAFDEETQDMRLNVNEHRDSWRSVKGPFNIPFIM